MKEIDKRKISNNSQTKRTRRNDRREHNSNKESSGKNLNGKKTEHKAPNTRADTSNDSNVDIKPSESSRDVVIDYLGEAKKSEEALQDLDSDLMTAKEKNGEALDGNSSDTENESKHGTEEISDSDTIRDSVSSQGDSLMAEDDKVERGSRIPETTIKNSISESRPLGSRKKPDNVKAKSQSNAVGSSPRTPSKSNKGEPRVSNAKSSDKNPNNVKVPSRPLSDASERVDEKLFEVEVDLLDGASNGAQSVASYTEVVDAEENGANEDKEALEGKVEEMERRVEKLEEELRVVAALEISLYSVVPEHGSSAHKVHTPARRLSRLYIHACKHWTQDKRATIAKNAVSGLVLIAKSCGNDIPRLTYWLSNIVVLREIISQTFGSSRNSNPITKFVELNGGGKRTDGKSTSLKWKGGSGSKQVNGIMQLVDDWQETATLTAALEKVESWIFSRIVESVWWQAMTPHMQSLVKGLSSSKSMGTLSGPALGDHKPGSFSIDQWKNAFRDASQRLCPVRAGGHDCGCLPVLARMVMEHCVARLDVAMFNAILRESAHEIPTDPISDPIVDSKVLPIPAGDLSFSSGAQLKNAVGNWSRSLTDMFAMNIDNSPKEGQPKNEDDDSWGRDGEPKCFPLLDSLSDLLMLPKDMLMDRSIRKEVCPLISLSLVKRILCNFSPDEFCPDSVPSAVLEAVNAESIVESMSGDSATTFPYTAAPVVYTPPSFADVGEKVAKAGRGSQLLRNLSSVQRKGYTSDDELGEMESPLTSIIDKLPSSPHASMAIASGNGHVNKKHASYGGINARYGLLHEVWSDT